MPSLTFTSSDTWTVPANVSSVTVECWGGGAAGAPGDSGRGRGGGGGGEYARKVVSVTSGAVETLVVGVGGVAADGGDTYFRDVLTVLAHGGLRSTYNPGPDTDIGGLGGGVTTPGVGDVVYAGGNGGSSLLLFPPGAGGGGSATASGVGSAGGDAGFLSGGAGGAGEGAGGNGGGSGEAGQNGSAPGGGGGGGGDNFGASGDGAAGQIILTWEIDDTREEDVRGRQEISVDQPPNSGSDYPFLRPSADIQRLIGDLFLSYEDDACEFVQPFRVAWLGGFGVTPAAPPDDYSLINPQDLAIVDANDEVVFLSTEAYAFMASPWPRTNPIREVLEWTTERAVCRVTRYLTWSPAEIAADIAHEFPDNIVPEDGRLNPRTVQRITPRVRTVIVNGSNVRGHIHLQPGNNVQLELSDASNLLDLTSSLREIQAESQLTRGRRIATPITINVIPGAGEGQANACEEVETVVRKIAGIQADDGGNLLVDAAGCLRSHPPVRLVDSHPRTFEYRQSAALELQNDCGPCCDCDSFVRTYKGLKRQWFLWEDFAHLLSSARDQFRTNRDRWLAEKQCREAQTLRLVTIPEPACKLAIGAAHCNASPCCLTGLTLRFTVETFLDGNPYTPTGSIACSHTTIAGSPQSGVQENYTLAGEWPVFEAYFDYADPSATSRVSFRLCFAECAENMSVRVTVTAHAPDPDPSPTGEICTVPDVEISPEVQALWAASSLGLPTYGARAATSKLSVLNDDSEYASRCNC